MADPDQQDIDLEMAKLTGELGTKASMKKIDQGKKIKGYLVRKINNMFGGAMNLNTTDSIDTSSFSQDISRNRNTLKVIVFSICIS